MRQYLAEQVNIMIKHDMSPAEVLTDFELAIIQAIELAFPTTEVKGCFFHFAQAINQRISTLGL